MIFWREIRPDTCKTTEKMSLLQVFSEMTTPRSGFGQNSCAADEQVQACVFGSYEFNKYQYSLLQTDSDVIYSLRIEFKAWTQETAQKT